ncbi:SusE domain-containing protein [Flammeovirgaceae bacterium SG7u.111]|nr:SusE domain-containing protein [Flammeovirgaceae bacterium SG7u.132]WPO34861.1 SusE domain-containing protein [Flammeovirgaceae bacterium SG7u.111]
MKKYIIFLFVLAGLISSCDQEQFVGSGLESLRDFSLIEVPTGRVELNPLTPDEPIVVQWNQARSGFDSPVSYTWLAVTEGGDLEAPVLELPSDNDNTATQITFTHAQLQEALKNLGVAEGGEASLDWGVRASNGEITKISGPSPVTIVRYRETLADFNLMTPTNNTPLYLLESSADEDIVIKWEASKAGLGSGITYTWKADNIGGDFAEPILSFSSDNSGQDTTLTLTHQQLEDALKDLGIEEKGKASIIWTVEAKATDAEGVVKMAEEPFNLDLYRYGAGIALTFKLSQFAEVPAGYGVFLAGSLGDLGIADGNWQEPGSNQALKLELKDGVYQKTFIITPDKDGIGIEYKYFLVPDGGTSWGGGEQTFNDAGCQGIDNRKFTFNSGDFSDQTVEGAVVTWEGFCVADGKDLVKFTVDVPVDTPTDKDIYITGDLGVVYWVQPGQAAGLKMNNTGGTTYEIYLPMTNGQSVEFKFFLATTDAPAWGNGEQKPNGDNTGCEGVENRLFTYDGTNSFTGTVQTWEGYCPF